MADAETPDEGSCPPCRGTGSVISRLGGEERTVTCPWCDGTGRRRPFPQPDHAEGVAEASSAQESGE